MRLLISVSLAAVFVIGLAQPAAAEPAWGGNCLSCHGVLLNNTLWVVGEDLFADPDETNTGAPDRGTLPVFQAYRGRTKSLQTQLGGLSPDDTYAVAIRRLRFPGVENGRQLSYTGDCSWPEWGESSQYYTDPVIKHVWGSGPTSFDFAIDVGSDAGEDYYDLTFAVAGKLVGTGELFYATEHFYLQVLSARGDMDCDGDVDFDDINPFVIALSGQQAYEMLYPDCQWLNADCDADGDVDFDDINPFVTLLSGA